MTEKAFQIGDVVRMRGGGPKMVVERAVERGPKGDFHWEADCVWHLVSGEVVRDSFRFDSIEAVTL
jgi:uncharacterized protein YodC (DUF2158 family)